MTIYVLYCPTHARWEPMDADDPRGCDYCCHNKPCPYHPESWEIDMEDGGPPYSNDVEVIVLDDGTPLDD